VGVRSYDSLEVGEKVYTLGSPVGLELTLSDGLISGRRDEDGFHYVQTTAPISPGSSGGGLFDARGNLVGVTTLVLTGRERLNQALNFAIPAEAFWQK
jgi:S1-C subfamily serine protease